jgi:hypothetical protein
VKNDKYLLSLVAEYIFIILPFIILFIVRSAQNPTESFYMLSSWGIASSIIYGQVVVQLASALAKTNKVKKSPAITLHLTLLVAFGLVVNIVIYILMLVIPNETLGITQVILFGCASICHFVFGSTIKIIVHSKN